VVVVPRDEADVGEEAGEVSGVEADAEHRGRLELVAAGELFREETKRLEASMFGHIVGHNGASPP
jgi:hypothetical protein